MCSLTNYTPTVYAKADTSKQEMVANLFSLFFSNPQMFHALTDQSLSKEEQQHILMEELFKNPDDAKQIVMSLLQTGIIKI